MKIYAWLLFLCVSQCVVASDDSAKYPNRPVTIVVGFAPGGASDVSARLLATKLSIAFGKPFIVENRPGANSNIGTDQVVRAKPDGYTLLLLTIANATNMSSYKRVSYDTIRDLTPIGGFITTPNVLVTNPSMPALDLRRLVSVLKANPEKYFFASSGTGGSSHLAGELFKQRTGVKIGHIAYGGAAPAMADIIAGHVSLGFMTTLGALGQMQSGQLRPIAVAHAQRLTELPDVPTMAEAGLSNFEVSSWNGLAAPKGTPKHIVEKLNAEINNMLALPDVKEHLKANGARAAGGSPKQFADFVQSQVLKWREIVSTARITLD
jgi:tripartite-type tricarboxylate transporter receptor subunit TctC